MDRTHPVLLAALAALLTGATAPAKEIYTWTDENGVTHYVDTPPERPDARAVEAPEAYRPGSVSAAPAEPETPPADAAAGEPPEPELSAADAKRKELAEARAAARQEQAEREAVCDESRRRLAQVEPHRRVFYEDDQGETVRLDDEERVRLVEHYKQLIEDNCR